MNSLTWEKGKERERVLGGQIRPYFETKAIFSSLYVGLRVCHRWYMAVKVDGLSALFLSNGCCAPLCICRADRFVCPLGDSQSHKTKLKEQMQHRASGSVFLSLIYPEQVYLNKLQSRIMIHTWLKIIKINKLILILSCNPSAEAKFKKNLVTQEVFLQI